MSIELAGVIFWSASNVFIDLIFWIRLWLNSSSHSEWKTRSPIKLNMLQFFITYTVMNSFATIGLLFNLSFLFNIPSSGIASFRRSYLDLRCSTVTFIFILIRNYFGSITTRYARTMVLHNC